MVVDETTLSGTQYLHILVGTLEISHVSYLYDCQPSPCSPNGDSIVQLIDDAIRSLGVNRNSLCLLLSDAARYMVATSKWVFKVIWGVDFICKCQKYATMLDKAATGYRSNWHKDITKMQVN